MAVSGFFAAMQAFEGTKPEDRAFAKRYILNLFEFNGSHRVRFNSLKALDDYTRKEQGFELASDAEQLAERPSSWQVFYQRGNIQVRVKTDGTNRRPTPHMVVTLAVGKAFDAEVGKFNRQGDLIPKLGPIPRLARAGDWRTLESAGPTLGHIEGVDDNWAEACHFDLPMPFEASGAQSLVRR